MAHWFDDPITNGYQTSYQGPNTDTPHYAEDIGTPFHTVLTAPTSGTVVRADYQQWGGEIFVQPDNHSFPQWYMYHPDRLEVHTGQHVNAGQEIALSGGELPGYPGAEHPTYPPYSTGPHTHVGWFTHWITPQETGTTIPYGPDPSNLLDMARHGGAGSGSASPTFPIPSDIYNAVEPIASNAHVPDAIWETVAYVESGFDPKSYNANDPGGSYGLFQLNRYGQLSGLSAAEAFNPTTNARQAMPAISSAWNSLQSSFDPNSTSWWQKFAAQSGHPGGAPGQAVTDAEAAKLQAAYQQYAGGSSLSGPFGIPSPGDIGQAINNGVTAFFDKINTSIGGLLLRTGVGIAGVGLIWIGAVDIVAALRGESIYQMQQDGLQAIPFVGDKVSDEYEKVHRAAVGKRGGSRRKSGGKKKKSSSTSSSAKPKQESKPKTESTPAPKEATAAESGTGASASAGADAAALAAI